MGASVLLGGATTFLGVMPLAFSSTTVFMVVFKSFLAMVCLGCGVGLILLPVVLSLVGPVAITHDHHKDERIGDDSAKVLGSQESLQSFSQETTKQADLSSDNDEPEWPANERANAANKITTTPRGSVECSTEIEV